MQTQNALISWPSRRGTISLIHPRSTSEITQQAITRAKIPISSTPITEGRTAPYWAILAVRLMLLFCMAMTALNAFTGHWVNAGFTFLTAVAFGYALVAFVGPREGFEDTRPGSKT